MKIELGLEMRKRALRVGAAAALCVIAMGMLGPVRAIAQTPLQVAEIVKTLDGNSQAVVGRLTELNRLPAEEWRFHAGDLAHGEAADLDDSSWPVVKAGAAAPQDAVWFRRWIEVPQSLHGYDLTDATVWFRLGATANGPMPEIVYFNGRRVALGDDLEPIVLFDRAKPGDKALVAVKLLHTVDSKNFQGATLKIDFPAGRPNPEVLRQEFLSAALLFPRWRRTTRRKWPRLIARSKPWTWPRSMQMTKRSSTPASVRHGISLSPSSRSCSRPPSNWLVTRTSTRRGSGRGLRRWTW